MKKGLIIQGPIISKGRTGKTVKAPFSKVTPNDIVTYDCTENIINIFDKYGSIFDYIVVVTWADQDEAILRHLKSSLPKDSLLLIEDTTKPITAKGKLIPGNNKYRQFLSIYEGSKFLADLGCDYIFKIRSDQFLDLQFLVNDSLKKLAAENRSIILVPWFNIKNTHSIFNIPDFYFSAKTQDMLDFSYEYLHYPEVFDIIHYDIFFKWSLRSLSKRSLVQKYIKLVFINGNNLFLRFLINPIICKGFFAPLDNHIIDTIYWRGEKLDINRQNLSDTNIKYKNYKSTNPLLVVIKTTKTLIRKIIS